MRLRLARAAASSGLAAALGATGVKRGSIARQFTCSASSTWAPVRNTRSEASRRAATPKATIRPPAAVTARTSRVFGSLLVDGGAPGLISRVTTQFQHLSTQGDRSHVIGAVFLRPNRFPPGYLQKLPAQFNDDFAL